jgi:hypothetical protein
MKSSMLKKVLFSCLFLFLMTLGARAENHAIPFPELTRDYNLTSNIVIKLGNYNPAIGAISVFLVTVTKDNTLPRRYFIEGSVHEDTDEITFENIPSGDYKVWISTPMCSIADIQFYFGVDIEKVDIHYDVEGCIFSKIDFESR